jgi:hypothetical protein
LALSSITVLRVVGSTAAIGTIEFEPGLQHDLPAILDKRIPPSRKYGQELTWHIWQRTLVFTGDPTRAIARPTHFWWQTRSTISTLLPVGSEEPNNGKEVANLVVDVLVEAGIERAYGVAGDSLNGSTDVIRTGGRLQWVHMRHDEAGAFPRRSAPHGQIGSLRRKLRARKYAFDQWPILLAPRRGLNPCYRRERKMA